MVHDILPTEIAYKIFLLLAMDGFGDTDYLDDTSWTEDLFGICQWTLEASPSFEYRSETGRSENNDSEDDKDEDEETQSQSESDWAPWPKLQPQLETNIRKQVPRLQRPMTMFSRRVRGGKALLLVSTSLRHSEYSCFQCKFDRMSSSRASHGLKLLCRFCTKRLFFRLVLRSLVFMLPLTSILTGGNGCTTSLFVKRCFRLALTGL